MPTVFLPYIIPNSIEFNICYESSMIQTVCIYNPYAFDILFKVDNAQPQRYVVSNHQGLISSRQKLPLEITCRIHDVSDKEQIQVRFFKLSRHRHGHKARAQQQYLGFREVCVCTVDDHSQRERTPSQMSDRLLPSPSAAHRDPTSTPSHPGSKTSSAGSNLTWQAGDSCDACQHQQRDGTNFYVISNLALATLLLLLGFLLNQLNDEWFASNVMDGLKPQTLSIVLYTLAVVVIVKLLTYR